MTFNKLFLKLFLLVLFFGCQNTDVGPVSPKLTTTGITGIGQTMATSGGNITDNGRADITSRGVCWSTSTSPTVDGDKTSDGTGSGAFVSSLINLLPGTKYYVRAYAVNKIGTAYGNEISFTTNPINTPTLSTVAITNITPTSASSGGSITSNGGSAVTARGVCWSTSNGPTTSDSKTSDGNGAGEFVSALTNLSVATKYYVRAYATNSAGTAYGDEISFTTGAVIPTLTTTNLSSITATHINSGGTITSDGGSPVTARGVCWSTSANPTTANDTTKNSTGTGSYQSLVTGLTPKTTYYLRAYAINDIGTAYGNEITFTTPSASTTIYDSKETTIFNNAAGTAANGNYGAGAGQVIQVGFSSSSSIYAHGLIQFDLSSLPASAVIDSVAIQFTAANSGTSVPTISVYKLTQAWTEGSTIDGPAYNASSGFTLGTAIAAGGNDATWNVTDYNTSVAWTNVGGTYNSTSSATSADTNASLTQFTSQGLKTDVQSWVNDPSSNFGWILKISEPTSGSGKIQRYVSREGVSVGGAPSTSQPKLFIMYH